MKLTTPIQRRDKKTECCISTKQHAFVTYTEINRPLALQHSHSQLVQAFGHLSFVLTQTEWKS